MTILQTKKKEKKKRKEKKENNKQKVTLRTAKFTIQALRLCLKSSDCGQM